MSRTPADFQGFEDPPDNSNPNAPTWKQRVEALGGMREHAGRWAKYGPYSNNKSASYAAVAAREAMEQRDDFKGDALFSRVDSDSPYYVYVRVERVDPNVKAPSVLRSITG